MNYSQSNQNILTNQPSCIPTPNDPALQKLASEMYQYFFIVQENLGFIDTRLFGPKPAPDRIKEEVNDNLYGQLDSLTKGLAGLVGHSSSILNRI